MDILIDIGFSLYYNYFIRKEVRRMHSKKKPGNKIDAKELFIQTIASIIAGIIVELICKLFNL